MNQRVTHLSPPYSLARILSAYDQRGIFVKAHI
jgi:hypothetical protein